jgi:hypothetical protein
MCSTKIISVTATNSPTLFAARHFDCRILLALRRQPLPRLYLRTVNRVPTQRAYVFLYRAWVSGSSQPRPQLSSALSAAPLQRGPHFRQACAAIDFSSSAQIGGWCVPANKPVSCLSALGPVSPPRALYFGCRLADQQVAVRCRCDCTHHEHPGRTDSTLRKGPPPKPTAQQGQVI